MSQPRASEPPSSLVPYEHPSGLRLLVPAGWELSEDARPGVLLVAVEPEPRFRLGSGQGSGSFRANLVVTCEELPEALDLATWQAATGAMLPSTVDDYVPVADDEVDIAGMPAVYRVAQHRSKAGANVTMAQWAAVLPGPTGWSLTVSVATAAYPRRAALFDQVAGSWRPLGHGGRDSERHSDGEAERP